MAMAKGRRVLSAKPMSSDAITIRRRDMYKGDSPDESMRER